MVQFSNVVQSIILIIVINSVQHIDWFMFSGRHNKNVRQLAAHTERHQGDQMPNRRNQSNGISTSLYKLFIY